ncbi:MAG: phytanoyl-CoA dioxygenase family protein [Puniceicoccaceae bacterium]|nr:MAG: phytanoyl-CoA dioxygenase family protein [Puniceicoccaceae bacterium]
MTPGPSSSLTNLTKDQVNAFHEVGYCIVDNLYSREELDAIEAFFEEFKSCGECVFDAGTRYEELDKTKQQVRAMHPHRHSAQAKDWALNPKVLDVLETLFAKPPLLAQTMYYFKPPGSKGQGMHQDNFYLVVKPATCIAAWTPLDDAELENGCLYVAPGSHRCDIFCPETGTGAWMEYGDTHIRPFPRDFKPVPVPVRRGQTMFFGGQLIHGSGPNRHPTRSRRTFIGHYIDEASDQVARFYHPVLNRRGEPVSHVAVAQGGGPCGDGAGALH